MKEQHSAASSVYRSQRLIRLPEVDLLNAGLAHYIAKDYISAETFFAQYIQLKPAQTMGYYWRGKALEQLDPTMKNGLAVPLYESTVISGEAKPSDNKAMLLRAYAYLGMYEGAVRKRYSQSLYWLNKYLSMDSRNKMIRDYANSVKQLCSGELVS